MLKIDFGYVFLVTVFIIVLYEFFIDSFKKKRTFDCMNDTPVSTNSCNVAWKEGSD